MLRNLAITSALAVGMLTATGCGGSTTEVPTAAEAAKTPTVQLPKGEEATIKGSIPSSEATFSGS